MIRVEATSELKDGSRYELINPAYVISLYIQSGARDHDAHVVYMSVDDGRKDRVVGYYDDKDIARQIESYEQDLADALSLKPELQNAKQIETLSNRIEHMKSLEVGAATFSMAAAHMSSLAVQIDKELGLSRVNTMSLSQDIRSNRNASSLDLGRIEPSRSQR